MLPEPWGVSSAILDYFALFGGSDVLRCDAQKLADRLPGQC